MIVIVFLILIFFVDFIYSYFCFIVFFYVIFFVFFFFFFQAEDGIRDRNVTGVQTCALPISGRSSSTRYSWCLSSSSPASCRSERPSPCVVRRRGRGLPRSEWSRSSSQIGRASCRERV